MNRLKIGLNINQNGLVYTRIAKTVHKKKNVYINKLYLIKFNNDKVKIFFTTLNASNREAFFRIYIKRGLVHPTWQPARNLVTARW